MVQDSAVGFIGLGRMGQPICRRILAAGHSLVVHTRTRASAESLLAGGASWADSPAQIAQRAGTVAVCLNTVEASEDLFLGPAGLLAHAGPSTLLVEHGTISDELANRVGRGAVERGVEYVDAPLSGGPEGAEKGTLAIMVGGSEAAFARVHPLLRAYGQTIIHMGPVGCGTRAKLINQLLTFTHAATAAEALALAQRAGLDLGRLAELLRASFGHSRMLDRTLERVTARQYQAGAALTLFEKDLALIRAFGDALGVPLRVAAPARSILKDAMHAGLGDRDVSALRLLYPDDQI